MRFYIRGCISSHLNLSKHAINFDTWLKGWTTLGIPQISMNIFHQPSCSSTSLTERFNISLTPIASQGLLTAIFYVPVKIFSSGVSLINWNASETTRGWFGIQSDVWFKCLYQKLSYSSHMIKTAYCGLFWPTNHDTQAIFSPFDLLAYLSQTQISCVDASKQENLALIHLFF